MRAVWTFDKLLSLEYSKVDLFSAEEILFKYMVMGNFVEKLFSLYNTHT